MARQDSDGGGGTEKMCTLHAVVVLCFGCWQGLANRSMRIQDLYVGAFPIPRFISLFFKSYAREHVSVYPHTPTRIRTRTHIGSSSERTEHSRRGHPCSLRPRRRETSADALPFPKVLSTHRISRSGPRPPTFSPFSPAPPPPPRLPAPHRPECVCVCFITAGPITKLCAWGEEESGGHVL